MTAQRKSDLFITSMITNCLIKKKVRRERFKYTDNFFPISHELFRVALAKVPQRYK